MKFNDYTKTAFGNLKRRKMRTFLTAFAVSIGTMLIILMVSLGVGVQKLVVDAIKANTPGNSISVSPYKYEDNSSVKIEANTEEEDLEAIKPKFTKLDDSAINTIKAIDSVQEITVYNNLPSLNIQLNGIEKKSSRVIGMDYNYSIFSKDLIETAKIKEKDKEMKIITYGNMISKDNTNGVLIGEKLLKKFGVSDYNSVIGKEILLTSKLPDAPGIPDLEPMVIKCKIEGVVNEKFGAYADKLVISLDKAKELLNYINLDKNYFENKGPANLEVIVNSMGSVGIVSDKISNMGYGVSSIQSMIKDIKSVFAIIEVILAIIGIVIIFVASIGVINTMTMSIYERTRSIGILKALGASKRSIRWLFITESGAIGFIGGLLGLAFSFANTGIIKIAVNSYLKSKGVENVPSLFSTPLWLIAATMGFAILISVLAGLYPANKAAKLDPVESLRYE
jgi:putative ABC transport system permease protein